MTNQNNQGIYIPQRQLVLLLASIMITVSAAVIFSAIFVTNLIQGQVASALASQSTPPPIAQTASRTATPATLADTELLYDDPYQGCTVPTSNWLSDPVTANASDDPVNALSNNSENSTAPSLSSNTSNTYNNDYRTTSNTENTDNGTYYSHSFNQGSYNTVKGDLTQTNTNNNSSSDTGDTGLSSLGTNNTSASSNVTPQNKSVAILTSSQPTIATN